MLSKIKTASLSGLDGENIIVETDVGRGLPSYNVVGLGDAVIREAGLRIKSAIMNSGFEYPQGKITANLAPAASRKEGSHFDLPLALGILTACGNVAFPRKDMVFLGELSLDGRINPVKGILPLVMCARQSGAKEIIVPASNAAEAALVKDARIIPARRLLDVASHISGEREIEAYKIEENIFEGVDGFEGDYLDVTGQENAKRVMVICAAGGHGLMMTGPPGAGKTMLAKRIPKILPPLTYEECLEVTKIYSVAGMLSEELPMIKKRPFRRVHHDISKAALLGGGHRPTPGEFSLAHQGVLFMDELAQFKKDVIESLREPLEERKIRISRHGASATFPGNVILIAAANPCPCGHAGDPTHECKCSAGELASYERKISNMIMDRIDMHVRIPRIEYDAIISHKKGLSSAEMRQQVEKARRIQRERYTDAPLKLNAHMLPSEVEEMCALDEASKALMKKAYDDMHLTMRTYHKTMMVARTIADLEGAKSVGALHLAEALQYRGQDERH